MPTLAGNKRLSIQLSFHMLRHFRLLTEKVRAYSVKNGHQSAYSRANTLSKSTNKISKDDFPMLKKYLKIQST